MRSIAQQTTWTEALVNRIKRGIRVPSHYYKNSEKEPEGKHFGRIMRLQMLRAMRLQMLLHIYQKLKSIK